MLVEDYHSLLEVHNLGQQSIGSFYRKKSIRLHYGDQYFSNLNTYALMVIIEGTAECLPVLFG